MLVKFPFAFSASRVYISFANSGQCQQRYNFAKITTAKNWNLGCYNKIGKVKAWGERMSVRQRLLHLFSGNVLFMQMSHSFYLNGPIKCHESICKRKVVPGDEDVKLLSAF